MINEFPSEEDIQRFSDATGFCPDCGEEIYDDSDWCPKCNNSLHKKGTGHRHPLSNFMTKKIGVIVLVILLLAFLWAPLKILLVG
tara:strand:+ start:336 stop:590 length:255 start_codon:yes stop_codon:yes gene_type:complete